MTWVFNYLGLNHLSAAYVQQYKQLRINKLQMLATWCDALKQISTSWWWSFKWALDYTNINLWNALLRSRKHFIVVYLTAPCICRSQKILSSFLRLWMSIELHALVYEAPCEVNKKLSSQLLLLSLDRCLTRATRRYLHNL
jgi:hypothetical protein